MTVRQQKRVRTLIEAMPYIRRFWGATIIVKYGGAAMTSAHLRDRFAADIALIKLVGMNPVVVHGGGPEISKHMGKLGLKVKFVDGLRVTDAATMEVARMVLVGKVNAELVGLINTHGGTAVGLTGQDGRLLLVHPKEYTDAEGSPIDLGFVGEVSAVNTEVLDVLAGHMIPVVASVGTSGSGQGYNLNADTVAGELAAALRAEKVVFLTDVGGLYDPLAPEEPVVSECDLARVAALEEAGAITGGMLPKVAAVRRALDCGVKSAHIVDGRVEHALLLEILTDAGCGTKIVSQG
jgi:acetylglutamate kinase